MSEDNLQDQINKGRAAAAMAAPVRQAAEQVKNEIATFLLSPACKPEEMEFTRRLYHTIDKVAYALETIAAGGRQAEKQLADIQQGRHRIFNIA